MANVVQGKYIVFFFQARDGIRGYKVTGVQTCALPIFNALLRLLRRAARATPHLVVFDDLHAADRFTLLALQVVARSLRDLPLVVLVTLREAEGRLRAEGSLLEPILREGSRFSLGRLSEAEVVALLAKRGAAFVSTSARSIHRMTEGNPLYVEEMARLIASGQ